MTVKGGMEEGDVTFPVGSVVVVLVPLVPGTDTVTGTV